MAQQRQLVRRAAARRSSRRDPHQVLLLDLAVVADQLLGDAAVLGQHEQADRVDVEPAGGHQAPQVLRLEVDRRAVLAPLPFAA